MSDERRSVVREFKLDGYYFRHVIDLDDDNVYLQYLTTDHEWKQLLIYTHDGYVRTSMDSAYIGTIRSRMELGRLVFKATIVQHEIVGADERRVEAFLDTEVLVSQWWLPQNEALWKHNARRREAAVITTVGNN